MAQTVSNFQGTRQSVDITGGSKTITAADSGLVQNVINATPGQTTTITLPAAAAALVGLTVVVRSSGNNGDNPVVVATNAADGVSGLGITAAVGKGVQNLSPIAGDEIELTCSGVAGAAGWYARKATSSSTGWVRVP